MESPEEDESVFVERSVDENDVVFNLAGAILAEKPPHRNGILNGFKNAWGSIGDGYFHIIPVDDRVYSIVVRDAVLAKHILDSGPWNVDNRLFNVVPWSRSLAIEDVDFSEIYFWIQIHNIPLGMMSAGTAMRIARRVGEVLEVEDPVKIPRPFLRVRVKINGRKPLYPGFHEPKSGPKRKKIRVKYERLKDFCYRCGRIGHSSKFCHWDDAPAEIDNLYGPELCVSAARKLNFDENPANCQSQQSSFWDGFGGGGRRYEREGYAPRFVRKVGASHGEHVHRGVSDSVTALQLANAIGPRLQLDREVASSLRDQTDGLGQSVGSQSDQGMDSLGGPGMTNMNLNGEPQLVMIPPGLSSPTNSSIHTSGGESLIMDAYRSPIILSDFSENDMDTSENQNYHVTEASDEEESGALVPVVIKSNSPIASEVNLVTVFDRLKLKRPSESCESGPCMKMLKSEMLGCIVRKPMQPLADNHVTVARSKSQRGAVVKGGGRNRKGSKVNVTSVTLDRDENLVEVSVNQISAWNDLSVDNGCGGGPNSATRAP